MSMPRRLGLAVVIGGLYALGAFLTFWYFNAPESGAAFFPPAGLTLAVLLVMPRRTWPLWLAAVAVAEISVDLLHEQTLFMAVGFAIANVVEPCVGASLMLADPHYRSITPRRFLVRYVVCAVIAGPLVGAFIGGAVATIAGTGNIVETTAKWWLGDALGVLVVATPVLAWRRRHYYETSATLLEMVGIAAVALAITIAPALLSHESLAYAVLPVLMWAALRGGPLGVGISGVAAGFSASWVVASGHASDMLTVRGMDNALVDTQLFIAVTLLAALTLAVEVSERTRAERASRQAETDRVRAELAALQAAVNERRRIVRETHDVVGHALNVMILSSAAARHVVDRDSRKATELLATVEEVGRDAFRDLDVALGLTDRSPDFAPLKGLSDLEELVARLVQAGMHVEYKVEGTPRALPRLVDGSAYRIIQESLTNVARHAVDARAWVNVRFAPRALFLEVSDHGGRPARPNGGGGGRGLLGMRERVAVLGGRIETGPNQAGGYSVLAELPLEHA